MSSAIRFNLDQSKIMSSGNGLMHLQTRVRHAVASCFFKHVGLIVKIYHEFLVNMFSNTRVI